MTFRLSREKVLEEIDQLGRQVAVLKHRIEILGVPIPEDVREEFRDLESSAVFAKQLTCSNVMDHRRAELGLAQLRGSMADIKRSLDELERKPHPETFAKEI